MICTSETCENEATWTVHWPGQTTQKCSACKRQAEGVASAMGFTLSSTLIDGTMTEAQDSAGKSIRTGDTVRFRGREYIIAGFMPGVGRNGTAGIIFTTELHVAEMPDEISVDLV
jgi:hypothetical protein